MGSRRKTVLLLGLLAGGAVVAYRQMRPAAPEASEPFMSPSQPSVRPPDPTPTPVEADVTTVDPDEAAAVSPLPGPPKGPFAVAPEGPADDLKRISGVGPKLEAMLNDEGITTFAQLAELDEDQVEDLQARLPQFPGRIQRDDWVGQAQRLRDA